MHGEMNPKTTTMGNRTLVEYGIQTCESECMAHICPRVGKVYMYFTIAGQEVIENGNYPKKPVWTQLPNGKWCETAKGYPVPWNQLAGIQWVDIPEDLLKTHIDRIKNGTTSDKGRWAEWIFQEMRKRGLINYGNTASQATDIDKQIRGIDIEAQTPTYQVKYDGPGGHREFGGTGNLFLQTEECNPLGLH